MWSMGWGLESVVMRGTLTTFIKLTTLTTLIKLTTFHIGLVPYIFPCRVILIR